MEWLSKLIEFCKLPLRIIAFILVLTGILFFLPTSVREYFMMTRFYGYFGEYIGVLFFISGTYLLFLLLCVIVQKAKIKQAERTRIKRIQNEIHNLSSNEIVVLREFIFQQSDSIKVILDDTGVCSLIKKGIITITEKSPEILVFGRPGIVSIDLNAKIKLTLELLNLTEHPSEEEKQRVLQERPSFTRQLEYYDDLKNRIANPFYKLP